MKNQPIVIERIFDVPVSTIWKAITDKDQMKKWYFDLSDFKPVIDFEFEFQGGKDDRQYRHLCNITEVVPEKKLAYSWRYDGYEGISFVSFELLQQGTKTKLILIHSGLESFPLSNPDFERQNFVGGWNYIVNTSLKNFLEKQLQNI